MFKHVVPKEWTTWDGVTKKISEIDHQHLSNIIHFMAYINPNYSPAIKFAMNDELMNRFGNRLLPYRPIGVYVPEMKVLRHKGYLVSTETPGYYKIIVHGKEVGEYTEK